MGAGEDALHRDLELLTGAGVRDPRDCEHLVRRVAWGGLLTEPGLDRGDQVVIEFAAVVEDDEQRHPQRAEEHIVGYTLYNDWTARDHQVRDIALGIGMGKSKDSATTLGPALVTVDELEPYRRDDGRLAIELSAAVNGKELTRGTIDLMDWSFRRPALLHLARRRPLTR